MKRIPTFLICACLAVVACKKAPIYLSEKTTQGGGNVVPGEDPPIENTPVTDTYLGLQCKDEEPKGFRAWRRLSNIEFKNTVSSVFGVKDVDFASLPDDITRHTVYDTMMVPINFVDAQRFRSFFLLATSIAEKADLSKLFPCLSEGNACISKTVPTLGALAWRRPLKADEVSKIVSIFSSSLADLGDKASARLIIRALLLSESFLYRSELGVKADDGSYALTDWEMASALSYNILRQPPDETLRKLAAAKKLNDVEEITKQITRLFGDDQSKNSWKDFANQWLDSRSVLKAERTDVKEFTSELKSKTAAEVGDFFSEVFNKPSDANLETLLSADSIPASSSFIYNSMPSDGRIRYKENERRGLLGQGSFLVSTSHADDTSPVKRGAFVIERLLCTSFAPVQEIKLPPRVEGESNRTRYLKLSKLAGCKNCHLPMNEFGFVFENFDRLGHFRTEADGEAVTVEAKVNIDGEVVEVNNAAELSLAIAQSQQGKECFARHIFRYSLGRQELSPMPIIGAAANATVTVTKQMDADNCQIKSLAEAMDDANGELKAPIIRLLTSDAFRTRVDRKKRP